MVYVNLHGGNYGIGVVGDNLSSALAKLIPIERLESDSLPLQPLSGPLLERFNNPRPSFTATRSVAYIVFECDLAVRRSDLKNRCGYDALAPTSRWCEQALRDAGLSTVTTIHHGVDGTRFNIDNAQRRSFLDRFVVFSGGKIEFRKGQDIVVRAFQIFAERHSDVLLLAAWHNPWQKHAATMAASPYLPYAFDAEERLEASVRRWLAEAGVDLRRVALVPELPNAALPALYGNSDVGLFPNRCEGATNLVMMEYMACGRPVIATDFSGHRDILSGVNSYALRAWKPLPIVRGNQMVACWCEPDIDELVEALELAYRERDRFARLGQRAADDLKEWTWERAAERFINLLHDC